jgi:hypothetical protein
MTAAELLAELNRRGISLRVQGDRLELDAPRGALTPELRRALADHKAELLRLLADPLADWLAAPVPLHVEPPTSEPTIEDLEALADRMDSYLQAGTAALDAAPVEHARIEEACQRLAERRAARMALGDLLNALTGERYDRARLGRWTAAQCFREADMRGALAVVDAIHDERSSESDEGD